MVNSSWIVNLIIFWDNRVKCEKLKITLITVFTLFPKGGIYYDYTNRNSSVPSCAVAQGF